MATFFAVPILGAIFTAGKVEERLPHDVKYGERARQTGHVIVIKELKAGRFSRLQDISRLPVSADVYLFDPRASFTFAVCPVVESLR